MPQSIDVGVLGGHGFVLAADHVPQPFDCVGQIHCGRFWVAGLDTGGPRFDFNIRNGVPLYEPGVQDFRAVLLILRSIKVLHFLGLGIKLFSNIRTSRAADC